MEEKNTEIVTRMKNVINPEEKSKKEPQKKYSLRYYKWIVLLGIIMIFLLFIFSVCIFPLYSNAEAIGIRVGETNGEIVGLAVGSFKGVTEEIPSGLEDGKEQALSAKDTEVDVTKIEEIGGLDVLSASVVLYDYHEIADDYKAIYVYKADAVFTVDLKNAVIARNGNQVVVTLDEPSVEFYINEDATEKVAEWQKHFYSGKLADGYTAYINSCAEIEKKSPEEIENYSTLMELAKDSAQKQIKMLVSAICDCDVEIIFGKGE